MLGTFPFISHVPVQQPGVRGVFREEKTQGKHVAKREPKVHVRKVFVLLHEQPGTGNETTHVIKAS